MISPSDGADVLSVGAEVSPASLLDRQRGGIGVSRLEFHAMEASLASAADVKPLCSDADEANLRLKEEIAELQISLQLQERQMLGGIEAARKDATAEARREWEQEMEEKVLAERRSVLRSCEEFYRERTRYFAEVESEVVKLALAIAARVLHREVNLDPLLLAGVVRVALEKIEEDSATVLRVPIENLQQWKELFSAIESSGSVVGDERLGAGECVLETRVGKIELGVSAQLTEVETGFFDLLQRRPT